MSKIDDFLYGLEPGQEVEIPKYLLDESSEGWKSSIGIPKEGSLGQYRKGRLHAHDMGDYYAVHIDRVDPDVDLIGHLAQDAPGVLAIGLVAAGAAVIWAATREDSG